MTHHCHARDCTRRVPPEMLMCRDHWRRVPRVIQGAVWDAYRPGQCDDKRPSEAWHEAADAAIGFVAQEERRPLRASEKKALKRFKMLVDTSKGKQ